MENILDLNHPMACDISIRRVNRSSVRLTLNPYQGKKVHSPNLLKEKCISEVVRIGSSPSLFPLVRGELFGTRVLARRAGPSVRGRTLFVRECRGETGAEDRGAQGRAFEVGLCLSG